MIDDLSMKESVYHVYNNMDDVNLHVDLIHQGSTEKLKEMINTDGHGRYFSWV